MQAVWRLAAALILHLGLYGPSANPRLVSEIVETAHAGALALLTNIRGVAAAEKRDPATGVSPVPVPLKVNLLGPGASNRAATRATNMGGSGGGMVAGGGISSSRALTSRRSTRFRTTRTAPAAPAQVLVPSRTTSTEVPLVNRNGDRVLPGTGKWPATETGVQRVRLKPLLKTFTLTSSFVIDDFAGPIVSATLPIRNADTSSICPDSKSGKSTHQVVFQTFNQIKAVTKDVSDVRDTAYPRVIGVFCQSLPSLPAPSKLREAPYACV